MESSRRKEQIISITLNIIGEQGLAGLTIAKIAKNAKISEAALYKHFKGKNDILEHCIGMIEKRLIGTIRSLNKEETTAIAILTGIYNTHINHIQVNKGVPRIIYTSEIHSQENFRTRLFTIIETYLHEIEEIIVEGQKVNTVSQVISAGQAARRFLSIIQFAAFRYSLSGFNMEIIEEGNEQLKEFLHTLEPTG
ncbi:MAG: TetR/AcrR family transcriptional regulator [Leptospirales bacterium]